MRHRLQLWPERVVVVTEREKIVSSLSLQWRGKHYRTTSQPQ
jgi:hypothetical protein